VTDSSQIREYLRDAMRRGVLIPDRGLVPRHVLLIEGVQFTIPATFDGLKALTRVWPTDLRDKVLELRIDRIKLDKPDSRNRYEWTAVAETLENVSLRNWSKERGRRPSSSFERVQTPTTEGANANAR